MQETFLFEKKEDLKFNFYAVRWDEKANKPTDVYEVIVRLRNKKWLLSLEANTQAIISHAKDIEAGLLVYPLHRDWAHVPVREVLFKINPIGRNGGIPKLVKAEGVM